MSTPSIARRVRCVYPPWRPARQRRAGWRRLAATFLVLALAPSAATAQRGMPRAEPTTVGLDPAPLQRITETLERAVERQAIAGAVVGVARHGSIAYLESFGVQDVATGAPMTERSLFRVYSMTKAVTAVAAMVLHEEGRYRLDEPVVRYLPEFGEVGVLEADGGTRPPTRPVSVRDLFLHTSGLSHRTSPEYREAGVRSRAITLEQFIENITRVPLREDPGTRFRYSASPTVLGRLVEVWSGQPFDRFVQERVLDPLGMDDTMFWVTPEDTNRLTEVYARAESGGLTPYPIEEVPFTERPALMEGAVGLVSTVPDFLRFSQMLLDRGVLDGVRVLPAETVAAMLENGLPPEVLAQRGGGTGWGLANVAVVVDPAGAEEGSHAGEFRWDGSAGTEFWVDPQTGTILVTAWQSAPANPDRLRQRIRALVREAIQS